MPPEAAKIPPPEPIAAAGGSCRFCDAPLAELLVDLGASPPANRYPASATETEPMLELRAWVCAQCFLVQLGEFQSPAELFGDYAYFSSFSDTWLRHAERYCAAMTERLALGRTSRVVEIASNDGYLLQYFQRADIPVLGIEPAANVAEAAKRKGIDTVVRFFGRDLAAELVREGRAADLLIANNVLAHVPDLNDFVAGLYTALKPEGVLTVEFPHLLNLLAEVQFDTIYHEHFSYFSLLTVERVFARHGLVVFDVDELPTHGGSLRIFAARHDSGRDIEPSVARLQAKERSAGLERIDAYRDFAEAVGEIRTNFLNFLADAKSEGRTVAGYGAPAKAATLLNYCGVGPDQIAYTVDRSPHKQGKRLPGVGIPIFAPEKLDQTRPDYIVILPWNLRDEIIEQLAHARKWGARFVVAIPRIEIIP